MHRTGLNAADCVAANRRLWDEWTAVHERAPLYDVAAFLREDTAVRLAPEERAEVGDVRGKDLLHLQCHFGQDTLSWARLGARVTGVDFSPAAIALAEEHAERRGLDARFLCRDLSSAPIGLRQEFDIVYVSIGSLGWLPDLAPWAETVAEALRPRGFLYVLDIHPLLLALDDGPDSAHLRLHYPYLPSPVPIQTPVVGSYADPAAQIREPVHYSWPHSLGELVTRVAGAGLRIDFLHEHTWSPVALLPHMRRGDDGRFHMPPGQEGLVPPLYSLKATRT